MDLRLSDEALTIARRFDRMSQDERRRFKAIFLLAMPPADDERVRESIPALPAQDAVGNPPRRHS